MILETCKYFEGTGNFCSRVTAMRCDEFPECEFKYIAELKAENEKLKSQIKDLQVCKDRYYLKGLEQERQMSDYITLLQEIKAIAEYRTKTEDYLLGQEYTDLVDKILDLLTKAESEG